MKTLRACAAWLALVLAFGNVAHGQEQKFEKYNFAVTPPDGWQLQTNLPVTPGLVAAYGKPDKTALLILIVDTSGTTPIVMNDEFVKGFNKGVEESGGGTLVSGSFVEAYGMKVYERSGEVHTVSSVEISTFARVIPSGSTLYSLQWMRFDGDASQLPEMRKSLESFRFLTPPPPPPVEQSTAYQYGYITGRILAWALIALGAYALIRFFMRK